MLEYRPSPSPWRLALLSFAQIAIALWSTSVAVAALEIAAVKRWIFYATPWDTPWHRLGVRWIDVDPRFLGPAAVGAFVLAAIVLWLWPTRQTLASRHFAHVIAGVLAIFGAFRLGLRAPMMFAAPAMAGALIVAFVAERRALSLLANVFALTLHKRLVLWCIRIAPAALLAGAASWLAQELTGAALAAAFAASTLAVAFNVPPKRFERLDDIELRRSVLPLAFAAFVIIAGSAAVFGVINSRAIVATSSGWQLSPWSAIRHPPRMGG